MKKSVGTASFAILLILLVSASATLSGAIAGSKHDFSGQAWAVSEICRPCHFPHGAYQAGTGATKFAPLWNHTVTTATFTVYASPSGTFQGGALNVTTGSSLACLSCHDGTVALDAMGGAAGTVTSKILPINNVGTDLTNDHPVGFTYDATLATADGFLANPATTNVTLPTGQGTGTTTGTIAVKLLQNGRIECASCHDVHNTPNQTYMLKMSNTGSALCRTCHLK